MTRKDKFRPWEVLEEIAREGDSEQLEAFIDTLSTSDATHALSRVDEEMQNRVVTTLQPGDAADLLEQIPGAQAAGIVEQLTPEDAAAIITELPSAEKADLLAALDEKDAQAIIAAMDPEHASSVERLIAYSPVCAGGIMVTEYLAYDESAHVRDVINDLRAHAEQYANYQVQYVYVVTKDGKLRGVLRLRDLLLAPDDRSVKSLMIPDPLAVLDTATINELSDFFDGHDFFGVPVVDEHGKLVGVVRAHDVEEAIGERAESDYLKSQGIVGGEELRSMPLLRRSSRRLSWLSVNVVLNIIAASVIAMYQDTLSAVIALTVFLPIISDMSGCAGSQAVAVSMRELTLGLVKPYELFRVWWKEITIGVLNGCALGAVIALLGWLWQGNLWLGIVAGGALMLNTCVAVSAGGCIPLLLKRLKLDPALASGPILTTVTDMCGFFLVLSFATMMLERLT